MSPNLPQHLTAASVRRMFRLTPSAFYRAFDQDSFSAQGIMDAESVVAYLNDHKASNIADEFDCASPLLTERDVAPLLVVDGHPATPGQVRRFCRRSLFPIPHVRFSRSLVRFPPKAVEWWLSPETRRKPVPARKFYLHERTEKRRPVR